MEGMELIAFEIISNVGTAKSLAVEALRDAREGKYEEAEVVLQGLKKARNKAFWNMFTRSK